MNTKLMLIFVLCVILFIIIFQNNGIVVFNILFWKIRISTLILVPILLGIGFIGGFILGKYKWHSRKQL